MIQGGMNLIWSTRAPFLRVVHDRVFCDGTANEGVAGADTCVTAASGLRTHESHFAGGETEEARSGVPLRLTLRGRHDVGTCLLRTFWCLSLIHI